MAKIQRLPPRSSQSGAGDRHVNSESKYIRVNALMQGCVPCASKSSKKEVVNSAWNAGRLLRRDACAEI